MADLTKRSRHPHGFYQSKVKVETLRSQKSNKKAKISKKKIDQLYEIEIIEKNKDKNMVKIHYTGFSDKFDERRSCENFDLRRLEKRFVPQPSSVADRSMCFADRLRRKIKFALYPGKKESPDVRIEEFTEKDVFEYLFAEIGEHKLYRGKTVTVVEFNEALDVCFGLNWSTRIVDENGDFSFVIPGTIQITLNEKKTINEYKYIGGLYLPSELENDYNVVFSFVRGDGNKLQYLREEWKWMYNRKRDANMKK